MLELDRALHQKLSCKPSLNILWIDTSTRIPMTRPSLTNHPSRARISCKHRLHMYLLLTRHLHQTRVHHKLANGRDRLPTHSSIQNTGTSARSSLLIQFLSSNCQPANRRHTNAINGRSASTSFLSVLITNPPRHLVDEWLLRLLLPKLPRRYSFFARRKEAAESRPC